MLLSKIGISSLALFVSIFLPVYSETATHTSPKEALSNLIDGNKRYVEGKLLHPNRDQEGREYLLNSQAPFAVILGCSDSRVSPEILFDQGIGDLFVVRVAGNIVGPIELDSIDYATIILKSSLVLVLGHENCGAVDAVINHTTSKIETIANLIEPAVRATKNQPGNHLENAIKENVRLVVEQLRKSQHVAHLIEKGEVAVVGGYYRMKTGEVEILSEASKVDKP